MCERLKDHHPQQQGLRQETIADIISAADLKDHHPQQQGLRQRGIPPTAPPLQDLKDHHPQQQGLRL